MTPRESELWANYQATRSDADRNALVEFHYGLVVKLARWHKRPDQVQLDEFISAGALGLIIAVERFEPERGLKFSTFASKHIIGQIKDYCRSLDPLTRTTRKEFAEAERIENAPLSFKLAAPSKPKFDLDFWNWLVEPLCRMDRLILSLIYRAGLTQNEAAQATGYHPSRVNQRLVAALGVLEGRADGVASALSGGGAFGRSDSDYPRNQGGEV